MSRSAFGIASTIGALVTTLVVAGCGSTENAQIIGVPPVAQVASGGASSDSAIAAFRKGLADQLSQAAAPGVPGANASSEINALASNTSLISAERMDALKLFGATTAASLEKTVTGLIAAASGDPHLAGAAVDGRSVSSTLLGLLRTSQAQIQALAAKIAGDTLVDVLRTDNLALAASHVGALLDPQAHLLIAAGDTLYQANGFAQTSGQLATLVNAGSASDPNYAAEMGSLGRLEAATRTLQATATSVVRQVRSLTAAGFPANQGTLLAQQQTLAQLNVPGGALATASSSIDQIRLLLGQRPQ